VVGVTAGLAAGSAAGSAAGPAAAGRRGSGDGDGGGGDGSDGGGRQRGPQTCGVAALHRHVRDELLQVIVGDVSWLERGERVPAVLVEGGSVKE